MRITSNFLAKNLVGTQVAQLATGIGTLHSVVINGTSTSPITLIDGAGGTTALIGTLKASVTEGTYLYDCVFGAGLRVNVQSNSDITVTFNQGS
jgi:hypothetical protein